MKVEKLKNDVSLFIETMFNIKLSSQQKEVIKYAGNLKINKMR